MIKEKQKLLLTFISCLLPIYLHVSQSQYDWEKTLKSSNFNVQVVPV
jgi:hypothetical protein